MKERTILFMKYARLLVAILMVFTVFFYMLYTDSTLPDQGLLMTLWVAIFVFILGMQYHIEKKQGMIAYFLMLFSAVMLIVTILGFTL